MGAGWTRRANVTGALAAAAPSEGSGGAATGGLGAAVPPSVTLGAAAPDGVDEAAGGAAADGVVTALGAIAGGAAAAPPAVTEGMAGGGGTFLASAAAMAAASAEDPLLARSCSLAVAKGVASIRAAQRLVSMGSQGSLAVALVCASGGRRRAFSDVCDRDLGRAECDT